MTKFNTILFDLDGTLTDPKEGITKSVQYALIKMGFEAPDLDALIPFIGPPLQTTFSEVYGMNEENVEKAIGFYRERFGDVGLYENNVFEGVEALLKELKDANYQLAIATSKPTYFAEKILDHYNISHYFDVIVGSHLDGRRSIKGEVIADALAHFKNVGTAVMIGDRKHDIIGAKAHALTSIGVTFGYGSVEELQQAGADYIVDSFADLLKIINR